VRYAARKDTTHAPMVAALRELGFGVLDLAGVGKGCPDILIGRWGFSALIECKTPKNERKNATDTKQRDFAKEWPGCPVIRAYAVEDVLFNFNLLLKRHGWVR
jgi:Holliday junction resolvase